MLLSRSSEKQDGSSELIAPAVSDLRPTWTAADDELTSAGSTEPSSSTAACEPSSSSDEATGKDCVLPAGLIVPLLLLTPLTGVRPVCCRGGMRGEAVTDEGGDVFLGVLPAAADGCNSEAELLDCCSSADWLLGLIVFSRASIMAICFGGTLLSPAFLPPISPYTASPYLSYS